LKKEFLQTLTNQEYPGNVREFKKTCERLHTEHGDSIFSQHDQDGLWILLPPFDYKRYKQELETWNVHIQPLVEKYGLGFKYNYFNLPSGEDGIDADTVFGQFSGGTAQSEFELWDKKMLTQLTAEEIKRNPSFVPGMIELIHLLNDGIEKVPNSEVDLPLWFKSNLKSLYGSESLPYLLETIRRLETGEPAKERYPELSYLFDLKHDEAIRRFELAYLEFHSKRYPSEQEAAERVGLSSSTYRSKKSRLRKQLLEKEQDLQNVNSDTIASSS